MRKKYCALLLQPILSQEVYSNDYSCDADADPCPYTFDGECDNEFGSNQPDCIGWDCADCDLCYQWDLKCDECLQNGCYWCPTLGLCTNYNRYTFGAYCNTVDDFLQDSCNPPNTPFDDPLYSSQSWVFDLVNVKKAWDLGYSGNGVRVRINDDGVDPEHDEYKDRFEVQDSCQDYKALNGDFHGTAVASIVGAKGGNNLCSVGIAPGVTLSSCFALNDPAAALAENPGTYDISQNSFGIDACLLERRRTERNLQPKECPFTFRDGSSDDPCDVCGNDFSNKEALNRRCELTIKDHCQAYYKQDLVGCVEFLDLFIKGDRCFYNTLSEAEQEAIAYGITQGRQGKGVVYVWASGNTFEAGEDTNFQGYLNTRFTISVGAVNAQGVHAVYSTSGAALFVVAPGGGLDSDDSHVGANVGGGCHKIGIGTSFACPVVSGVIALMLEANPELSWRDVQGILATTSSLPNDSTDKTRTTNGAGITHSNYYGFGTVDAFAAVQAAKSWDLWEAEGMMLGESEILNQPMSDTTVIQSTIRLQPTTTMAPAPLSPDSCQANIGCGDLGLIGTCCPTPGGTYLGCCDNNNLASAPTKFPLSVPPTINDDWIAESVVVYLKLQHLSRGDLEIVLESPHGTTSVLHPGNRPENSQLPPAGEWKLLTVRNWGEFATGDWTLSMTDKSPGDVSPCADYPWVAEFSDDRGTFFIDCDSAENDKFYCRNGQAQSGVPSAFLQYKSNGRTPEEACCACGGGILAEDLDDRLVSWRIVVYGRGYTRVPTMSPFGLDPSSNTPEPSSTVRSGVGYAFAWALSTLLLLSKQALH